MKGLPASPSQQNKKTVALSPIEYNGFSVFNGLFSIYII